MSSNDSIQMGKPASVERHPVKVEKLPSDGAGAHAPEPIPKSVKQRISAEMEAAAGANVKSLPILKYHIKDEFGQSILFDCTAVQQTRGGLIVLDGTAVLAVFAKWSNYILLSE